MLRSAATDTPTKSMSGPWKPLPLAQNSRSTMALTTGRNISSTAQSLYNRQRPNGTPSWSWKGDATKLKSCGNYAPWARRTNAVVDGSLDPGTCHRQKRHPDRPHRRELVRARRSPFWTISLGHRRLQTSRPMGP